MGIEWSNWALVIVGCITFAAVLKQAIDTRKAAEATHASAKATEKAAKAALLQSEHTIASERAWLVIRSWMEGYIPSTQDKFEYWWVVENTGSTPARIIETQCMYELIHNSKLTALPTTPKYPDPIVLNGLPIPSSRVLDYKTFLRDAKNGHVIKPGDLDQTAINTIVMGMYCLRVYGYVKYMDVFDRERESRFCEYYVWPTNNLSGRGTGFRTLIGVPPQYTTHT